MAQRDMVMMQKNKLKNINTFLIVSIMLLEFKHPFLPTDEIINQKFEDHFVLYLPKDKGPAAIFIGGRILKCIR